MSRLSPGLYFAALASYAVSFLLPTFLIVVEGKGDAEYGFTAFMVAFLAAWEDMYGGPFVFLVWLANPAFWTGAVLFARGRSRNAAGVCALAFALGCRFMFADLILFGYYVWLGSMVLLMLASLAKLPHRTPRRE
jgi:hypothetical protein